MNARIFSALANSSLLFGVLEPHGLHRTQAPSYDIVVLSGRVIDPESGLDAIRNVGIGGGSVRTITSRQIRGTVTINARGLVVSPGFIDLHQHDQTPDDYALKAMDGVTTALELETGTDDVDRWYAERAGKALINYGVSAGHVPARVTVMRDTSGDFPSGDAAHRAATESEVAEMVTIIVRELERGALAVGTKPEITPAASPWELLEVFRAAARYRAPVSIHLRSPAIQGEARATRQVFGFDEAIAAAVTTGAPLHIAHLSSPRLLQLVADARSRGLDVTTEVGPYTIAGTPIQSALYDPGWQERLGLDYGDLYFTATGEWLTKEKFELYRKTQGTGRLIYRVLPDSIVAKAIASPLTAIISDGNRFHPREAGTYSRVLGKFVREDNVLSLTEALRKMTVLPATRLERRAPMMARKGRVRVGADADLTIFDAATIIDHATMEEPTVPSEGVRYVIVNGTIVVADGKLRSGVAPGRAIRAAIR